MSQPRTTRTITISDGAAGLPFSKGLLSSGVMVTGMPHFRAFAVAEEVERRLTEDELVSLTSAELAERTLEAIRTTAGESYALNYVRWREVQSLELPLVILIGGATGVGKSTIATQLAARMGIVRVIATDAIREVMRAVVPEGSMPTLHVSSFELDRGPRADAQDPLLAGFREQAATVGIGIRALVERAATEGTSMVVEGVHVVPGSFDADAEHLRVLAVPFVLGVEDEARHRSHLSARGTATSSRPASRYVDRIDGIRRLQGFVQEQALAHGVPVIANHGFDQTIADVVDLVMERAIARATDLRAREARGEDGSHEVVP
ncbi:MAG: AAA family ATPase [Actinomycetota bacterium]